MSDIDAPSSDSTVPTADAAVDAVIARAAAAATVPTSEHNGLYSGLLEELQRELDDDPSAHTAGGTP
ncbi:MAG: hypothetical protein WBX27_17665 [Specibacter sp.]